MQKKNEKSGHNKSYFSQQYVYFTKKKDKAANKFAFTLLLVKENIEKTSQDIFSTIYNGNIQIRNEKILSMFHKVNQSLLWFVNIIDCY